MLELITNVRPELLITWACISMVVIFFIIGLQPKKKSVSIPFKNSKGETIGNVEFTSYRIK